MRNIVTFVEHTCHVCHGEASRLSRFMGCHVCHGVSNLIMRRKRDKRDCVKGTNKNSLSLFLFPYRASRKHVCHVLLPL
jgi:hypothetical protein